MVFPFVFNPNWESTSSQRNSFYDTVCITGIPSNVPLEEIRRFFTNKEGPCLCIYMPGSIQKAVVARFNVPGAAQRVVLRYNNATFPGFRIQVSPFTNNNFPVESFINKPQPLLTRVFSTTFLAQSQALLQQTARRNFDYKEQAQLSPDEHFEYNNSYTNFERGKRTRNENSAKVGPSAKKKRTDKKTVKQEKCRSQRNSKNDYSSITKTNSRNIPPKTKESSPDENILYDSDFKSTETKGKGPKHFEKLTSIFSCHVAGKDGCKQKGNKQGTKVAVLCPKEQSAIHGNDLQEISKKSNSKFQEMQSSRKKCLLSGEGDFVKQEPKDILSADLFVKQDSKEDMFGAKHPRNELGQKSDLVLRDRCKNENQVSEIIGKVCAETSLGVKDLQDILDKTNVDDQAIINVNVEDNNKINVNENDKIEVDDRKMIEASGNGNGKFGKTKVNAEYDIEVNGNETKVDDDKKVRVGGNDKIKVNSNNKTEVNDNYLMDVDGNKAKMDDDKIVRVSENDKINVTISGEAKMNDSYEVYHNNTNVNDNKMVRVVKKDKIKATISGKRKMDQIGEMVVDQDNNGKVNENKKVKGNKHGNQKKGNGKGKKRKENYKGKMNSNKLIMVNGNNEVNLNDHASHSKNRHGQQPGECCSAIGKAEDLIAQTNTWQVKPKKKKCRRKIPKNKQKKLLRMQQQNAMNNTVSGGGTMPKIDNERFQRLLDLKKQEIEKEYDTECSNLLGVVKKLANKDPSMTDKLKEVLRQSLMELEKRLVKKLGTIIQSCCCISQTSADYASKNKMSSV